MPHPANTRTQVDDAPDGLDLVQELLNTRRTGTADRPRVDLLADGAAATAWTRDVLDGLDIGTPALDDADSAALRALRDTIRATMLGPGWKAGDGRPAADVALSLESDGEVVVGPADPRQAVRGMVLAEILLAQTRGEWGRLKFCALDACGAAFYDHSRNSSARYHSAWCANHVNLRASRARRRAAHSAS